MDLFKEKESRLSSRDRYDILTFAIEAADDGGFVSSFIFERAIYCYAAILLTEDEVKDNIRSRVSDNLINAWDYLIENDIIQELAEEYKKEFDLLAEEGEIWLEEYELFSSSARGVLSVVEQFTGDSVVNAANMLKNTAEQTGVSNILEIADRWGMNRQNIIPEKIPADWDKKEEETLF